MNLIPKLENYPGTLMSSGTLLVKTLENQYLSFNGEIVYDTGNDRRNRIWNESQDK